MNKKLIYLVSRMSLAFLIGVAQMAGAHWYNKVSKRIEDSHDLKELEEGL